MGKIDAGGHVNEAPGLVRPVQPYRFRSSYGGGVRVADEQQRARRAHCLPGGSPAEFADLVMYFLRADIADPVPFTVGGGQCVPCLVPGAEMSPGSR